ncbi:hypothetical protein BGZ81_006152 [Podila clonocystis]|nr:hypothetical protein BGZ81_006152 [Podila clonocystis]
MNSIQQILVDSRTKGNIQITELPKHIKIRKEMSEIHNILVVYSTKHFFDFGSALQQHLTMVQSTIREI